MVVLQIAGVQLIRLPQYIYPSDRRPTPDPMTGEVSARPTDRRNESAVPTAIPIDPIARAAIMAQPVTDIVAVQRWDLDHGTLDSYPTTSFTDYSPAHRSVGTDACRDLRNRPVDGPTGWWLASGRGGRITCG